MKAEDITLVVLRALEKHPEPHSVIVNDNGSQFTGKEFKKLIERFQLRQIRTKVRHPESNGIIERFHRSLREELSEKELKNLSLAKEIIGQWVDYYNHQRLHGIVTGRPYFIFIGDFDDDGILDIEVHLSDNRGSLWLLRSNGDGTFSAPQAIPTISEWGMIMLCLLLLAATGKPYDKGSCRNGIVRVITH